MFAGDSAGFIQSSTNGGETWAVVNDPSTGVNLNSTANNDGGIWDIEVPPAGSSASSLPRAGARVMLDDAEPGGPDLVVGPGEFIGSLRPVPPMPRITAFRMTNARFRLGSRPTAVVARAAKPRHPAPRRGSAFVYTLSAASTSAILFYRESRGRLVHGKCVPPARSNTGKRRCTIDRLVRLPSTGRVVGGKCVHRTTHNTHRKRCTMYTTAAIARRSHAGTNTVAFSGRIGRTALSPGTYIAVLVARIGNGPNSKPRAAAFTIVAG